MANVSFTSHVSRLIQVEEITVPGDTLQDVLTNVFERHKNLKSYIVDDQGALRKHVVIFIDGVQLSDRIYFSEAVTATSSVFIAQALSGG